MRTAEDLLADVMPTLPGVTMPALDLALLRAAQDMCRRTRCWSVWSDPVTIVDGVTDYEVDAPDGGTVEMVTGCTVDGAPADVLPWQWLDRSEADYQGMNVVPTGKLQFFSSGTRVGSAVRLKVVLVPGESSQGIPDAVFDTYKDVLANGVIARCAMQPGQPFTNLQTAAAYGAAFSSQISRMALQQYRGRTNAMPRATTRWC